MELTAREIADYLNGEIVGNPDVTVSTPARIEQGKPGDICFFANNKYEPYVYTSKATIILVNRTFTPKEPVSATLIKVDDAYQAVAAILEYYQSRKKTKKRGNRFFVCRPLSSKIGKGTFVGKHTIISKHVKIGKYCHIYPQVYIGENVEIGHNVTIYPGVKIYKDCIVGNNCILQSNCVIGGDGFGFAPREDGTYKKIPQTGNVVIEDDVEIGANTTIDRATMGSTVIHKGVKADNLCMLAHNTEIGDNTIIAAQTGIAGSTKVGRNCIFGGQVGISGHLNIADKTSIGAQSGIMNNIKKSGEVLMGYPAFGLKDFLRASAKFRMSGKIEK